MIAILVMGMLTTWIANQMMHDARVRHGEMIGKDMARLNSAVQDFVRRYHQQIKETAIAAVQARAQGPRDGQIRGLNIPPRPNRPDNPIINVRATTDNNLPVGQRHHLEVTNDNDLRTLLEAVNAEGIARVPAIPGANFKVRFIVGDPARPDTRCVSTSPGTCYIDSLVYIDEPITLGQARNSRPDQLKLTAALKHMGEGGGYAMPNSNGNPLSNKIRFSRSDDPNNTVRNPVWRDGASVPGILAIHSLRKLTHLPYIKLDGSTAMEGNLNLNRKEIKDASNIQASRIDTSKIKSNQSIQFDINNTNIVKIDNDGIDSGEKSIKGSKIEATKSTSTKELIFSGNSTIGSICEEENSISFSPPENFLRCNNRQWRKIDLASNLNIQEHISNFIINRPKTTKNFVFDTKKTYPSNPDGHKMHFEIENTWDHCRFTNIRVNSLDIRKQSNLLLQKSDGQVEIKSNYKGGWRVETIASPYYSFDPTHDGLILTVHCYRVD